MSEEQMQDSHKGDSTPEEIKSYQAFIAVLANVLTAENTYKNIDKEKLEL